MASLTSAICLACLCLVDASVLRAKPTGADDKKSMPLVPQNETMHLRAQQFMEVSLGPFSSAAEACDYCFGSFTKEGQPPAGPVAPFCVCMAYPDGATYNMFCATPPSAAEYIAEKRGCRCEAKDMEHLGQTTCKPI
mmetsp:Transcript_3636/g.5883  ORF Transcript_3636/g.5883 Transcript_3636/m.5883 type:complete len:137 (-) Transcript_3636:68-478(-)|eukprot:CAMPEP_0169150250 /NCGR_PEP_ID=MMETSP1015-20121227/50057_1 /TAXON_ID=342587 /ORGANISM="Karlodinium micrum, Strain CCMP2283" /LENGTH=136 /DNA_ID=CAMNT_0009219319 /DNA_START=69 /DNA_END=479 /DNA_ORIENTATION=+